jgi:hypothetical protein
MAVALVAGASGALGATPGSYTGKLVGKTGSEKATVDLEVGDDGVPFHFDVAPLKTRRCTRKQEKLTTPGQIFEAPFNVATPTSFIEKRPRHVVGTGIRVKETVTGAAASANKWHGTYLLDARIGYPFKKNHCHFSTTWTATLSGPVPASAGGRRIPELGLAAGGRENSRPSLPRGVRRAGLGAFRG